jgi:hypothetical protein
VEVLSSQFSAKVGDEVVIHFDHNGANAKGREALGNGCGEVGLL